MNRLLTALVLTAAVAAPLVASAHERRARSPQAGWVNYGYSNYTRPDYPVYGAPALDYPAYGAYASYAPTWSPGPRVYVYPHGSRGWYGPSVPRGPYGGWDRSVADHGSGRLPYAAPHYARHRR